MSIEIAQWLTDRQFSELFAMAQAAPAPNVMFVALLGHFIAGRRRRGGDCSHVRPNLVSWPTGCRVCSNAFARRVGALRSRPAWCR
jgi:hypothetical protein